MVYPKQSEKKRATQRRIYNHILRKPNRWASFTELVKAKKIHRCRRTISKALKEMVMIDAEYPLVKAKRRYNPYGLREDWKNWKPGMKRIGSVLNDLYKDRGIFKGVLRKDADNTKRILKQRAVRYLTPEPTIENVEKVLGRETLYHKKRLTRVLDKYRKQFQRPGYMIRWPEIIKTIKGTTKKRKITLVAKLGDWVVPKTTK